MSLTTLSAIAATIIFTAFAVIVAVGIIADTLHFIAETFEDEVREIPVECEPETLCDDFDALYMSVASGDKADCAYWLGSVRGGVGSDRA